MLIQYQGKKTSYVMNNNVTVVIYIIDLDLIMLKRFKIIQKEQCVFLLKSYIFRKVLFTGH